MDLQKLFVLVPAGTAFDGKTVSAKDNLIYFEQSTCTIWHKGVAYGITPDLAKKIGDNETAIAKLIALIGASEKAEDAKTLEERLEAVEQATSKPITIADTEKVLALDSENVLTSTLTINVAKHAESDEEGAAEHNYIQLLGIGGNLVAEVNADVFVADGMIETVEWKKDGEGKETSVLVITWNTVAGGKVTEVDMAKFIDTYSSGDEDLLKVEGYVITPVTSKIAEGATGLAKAADVYKVTKELDDNLAMVGTILVGNGDTYMDEETAKRYFVADPETGALSPSNISALQDITDLRHANEGVEKATSTYGTLFGGYNDPELTEEIAERWLEKDEEGDWVANGKSILPDIIKGVEAKEAIDSWDPWTVYEVGSVN